MNHDRELTKEEAQAKYREAYRKWYTAPYQSKEREELGKLMDSLQMAVSGGGNKEEWRAFAATLPPIRRAVIRRQLRGGVFLLCGAVILAIMLVVWVLL